MLVKLEGSWLETVTLSGEGAATEFRTLFTYDAGGGLTGTASVDLNPASLTGPSHGAWVRVAERSFRTTARAFAFDQDGKPAGLYVIREEIVLDERGQSYQGTGSFEVVNQGATQTTGRFVTQATRITADDTV